MKQRPRLLNTEMVQAVLDGRKNQTRGPLKPQPPDMPGPHDGLHGQDALGEWWFCKDGEPLGPWRCPFGVAGDLLYVRETCKMFSISGLDDSATNPTEWTIKYKAGKGLKTVSKQSKPLSFHKWTPSIHAPRWTSRLTLRVLRVWVERVQDISHDDCIEEGIAGFNLENVYSIAGDFLYRCYTGGRYDYLHKQWKRSGAHFSEKDSFESLWDSIYAKRGFSWDSNCWVWACEFEVAE